MTIEAIPEAWPASYLMHLPSSHYCAANRGLSGSNPVPGTLSFQPSICRRLIKALLVRGVPINAARQMLDALHLDVRPHAAEDAYAAAALHEATKVHCRGLGDRSCMALAIMEGLPAITTDQAWARLKIEGLKVVVVAR